MKGTPESTITAETSAKSVSRLHWRRIYYLLAAFNVITVTVSLYLLFQILSTYQGSARVHQEWVDRLNAHEELNGLIAAVNAPGNDVFDSRDVETESKRLTAASRLFDERIAQMQEELRVNVPQSEAAPLRDALEVVASTMARMVEESNLIFSYLRQHRPDLAGKRMASMDRNTADVIAALGQLRQRIHKIEQGHFSEQTAVAGSLALYGYIVAFAILLMVAGATVYGWKISKQVELDARQREEYLERLRAEEAALAAEVAERKHAEVELARLHEAAKAHAAQWEALYSLGRLLSQSLQLDEVFEAFAREVKRYIPYDRLGVIIHEDHTLTVAYAVADSPLTSWQGQSWPRTLDTGIEWIFTHRQPRLVQDLAVEARFADDMHMAREGVRTTLELPLLVGGEVQGVLYLDNRIPAAYSDRDIERLLPLTDQVAMVLKHSRLYGSLQRHAAALKREVEERARTEEQLRTFAARLESAREDERIRMAREIHEELGQLLVALKIDLLWLAERLPQEQPALQEKSRALVGSIDEMLRWVRHITGELRPPELDLLGLAAAIEWQANRFQSQTGIRAQLTVQEPLPVLDWEHSTAIFRILQEALSNVAHHAQGTRVHISLKADTERLIMEVVDNGKGITRRALADRHSLGLLGMRERAFLLGGAVTIAGQPGQGTTVTVLIPLHGPDERNNDASPGLHTLGRASLE